MMIIRFYIFCDSLTACGIIRQAYLEWQLVQVNPNNYYEYYLRMGNGVSIINGTHVGIDPFFLSSGGDRCLGQKWNITSVGPDSIFGDDLFQ